MHAGVLPNTHVQQTTSLAGTQKIKPNQRKNCHEKTQLHKLSLTALLTFKHVFFVRRCTRWRSGFELLLQLLSSGSSENANSRAAVSTGASLHPCFKISYKMFSFICSLSCSACCLSPTFSPFSSFALLLWLLHFPVSGYGRRCFGDGSVSLPLGAAAFPLDDGDHLFHTPTWPCNLDCVLLESTEIVSAVRDMPAGILKHVCL